VNNGEEYVTMGTSGSNVVRTQHPHIMQAGASARERLKEAAAQAWGVPRADVLAQQGLLTSGNHTGTYGEFASAAAAVVLDAEPEIKAPNTWWLLGNPLNRLEVPHKVNGSAQYAIDTRLEGMCYAAVKACPVPWGGLKGFNADAIKDRPGIIGVYELKAKEGARGGSDMQNGVAVVADTWFRAKTALDLLPIEWDFGENGSVDNAVMLQRLNDGLAQPGEVTAEEGTALDIIAAAPADKIVTQTYFRPYEAHARMEPSNATVWVQPDRVDVWSGTITASNALTLAASEAGRDTLDVWAQSTFIGGAFGGGGPGATAVTRQATFLSMMTGRPVQVIWTREEDITHDKTRSIVTNQFTAALGDDGLPTAWFTRSVGVENRANTSIANMHYAVPNRRHERLLVDGHIPVATHRAPGANQNVFMIESFVDEVALAGGWDPLEWRLKMSEHNPGFQLVLNTLKEKAGFRTDLPKGEGMGIAIVDAHGSNCATCATVTVSRRGQLTIEHLLLVIDSGYYINPLNAAEQAEGSAIWELSHVLYGGLDMRQGHFVNTNFDSYPLMRMNQVPKIDTILAPLGGERWGGMGEPNGPPTAAAVANAIFFATGKRVRSTPFKAHDLSWTA
jgi:isoquinoline 1-oxidoreductase beta subunit